MPLRPVDGFAQLGQIVGRIPFARVADVLPVALRGVDRERRVVLPRVGIADLHGEAVELLLCAGLRLVRHPVEGVDVLREGFPQVVHQHEHALLVLLGEVLGHVELAHGLREGAVGHRHGALPAGFHLLLPGHRAAEEIERRLLEVVAQVGCGGVDVLCGEVVAQLLERRVAQQFDGVGHRRGGGDDDPVEVADADRAEVGLPVDAVVCLFELGLRHGVVHRRDVAQLDVRPRLLGQLRLDAHHARDGALDLRLGKPREPEDRGEVVFIGRADVLVRRLEVVVAVAHAQPVLRDVEGVGVAVHQIGLDAHREEGVAHRAVERGDGGRQLPAVGDREDFAHGALDRSGALGVQPCRVEAHAVEVGDFLLDRSRCGLLRGHFGEEVVDAFLVVLAQHVERAVAREFGFEGVLGLPAARGVLVEVVGGCDREVHVRRVDGRRLGVVLAGCHADHGGEDKDFFHVIRFFRGSRRIGVHPDRGRRPHRRRTGCGLRSKKAALPGGGGLFR